MLSLTRRIGERIFINGEEIKIKIISCNEEKVKLSIDAPATIKITKEPLTSLFTPQIRKPTTIYYR